MKAEHTGRAVYALPDCGDCGKPVSLTDRVGHQPVYHRWCAEFRWERRMAERARRCERCAKCGNLLHADGVSRRCVCLVPSPPNR